MILVPTRAVPLGVDRTPFDAYIHYVHIDVSVSPASSGVITLPTQHDTKFGLGIEYSSFQTLGGKSYAAIAGTEYTDWRMTFYIKTTSPGGNINIDTPVVRSCGDVMKTGTARHLLEVIFVPASNQYEVKHDDSVINRFESSVVQNKPRHQVLSFDPSRKYVMNLHRFWVTNASGVVIHDFVPIRVGNRPGLYNSFGKTVTLFPNNPVYSCGLDGRY